MMAVWGLKIQWYVCKIIQEQDFDTTITTWQDEKTFQMFQGIITLKASSNRTGPWTSTDAWRCDLYGAMVH